MKIAIFTDAFLPQINGVVTHIVGTVEKFSDLGYEVLIIAPKPKIENMISHISNAKIEYISGLPSIVYPDFYLTNPLDYHILKIIKKFKPDIIHFHTPLTIGLNAVLIAKYLKIPLVGTFHAYFMEPEYLKLLGFDKVGLDDNKIINNIGWQLAKFFYDKTDVIICPSKFTKKDLIEHKFKTNIKVISNGMNLKKDGIITKKYKLPKEYFLYVGRISKEKSLDLLIESYRKFAQLNQGVDLVIVGDGPARDDLEKLVINYNLNDRVHFLGAISHDVLMNSNVFSQAMVFVSPSTSETQGLSILEACQFRLPIVSVKARALIELIKDNGILCQPDNIEEFTQALLLLTNNNKLRKKFSKKSYLISKNHSIDKTVIQLKKVYTSLL